MKTPEDEAFEDIERRQGGFQAKRQMAADKFKDGVQWWMDTKTYGAYPNPPQWHIDTGNLVRLVPQPAQEPSYWLGYGLQAHTEKPFDDATPLYTTPPQRPWVGLTDEDIADCMEMSIQKTCRAVEQLLKERNHGT